jgi:hypothetical protein
MTLTALSKTEHINLSMTQNPNFRFLKNQTIIPLTSFELNAAVSEIPVFFVRVANSFRVFGLLGLEENKNLCVNTSGSWELAFLPAALRVYPFGLGDLKGGSKTLMVPKKHDFFVERDAGQPLLNQNGTPTDMTLSYVKLLSRVSLDLEKSKKSMLVIERARSSRTLLNRGWQR